MSPFFFISLSSSLALYQCAIIKNTISFFKAQNSQMLLNIFVLVWVEQHFNAILWLWNRKVYAFTSIHIYKTKWNSFRSDPNSLWFFVWPLFCFRFFFFWGIGYVMFDAIVFGIVVTICLFLHHYDMNDKFVFHIDLCERKIKLICDKVTNEFYQWSNSNV